MREVELGTDKIEAPGQLASHYAPSKPLRLNAVQAEPDEYLIGFGAVAGDANLSVDQAISSKQPRACSTCFIEADASPKPRIAVAPMPDEALGARSTTACAGPLPKRSRWRSLSAPGSSS